MFKTLTDRLTGLFKQLRGQARLTEDNIKDTLREVRMALLEADVALPVTLQIIKQVQEKALDKQAVLNSISPDQAFIKLVHDELVHIMGDSCSELDLVAQPPVVILVVGLQGSGKTSTVAKLARWLKEHKNKSVLVVSADIYRPAAIEQLETLAREIQVIFHPSTSSQAPTAIVASAIQAAKSQVVDVVIVDTAGRLHVDDDMMNEVQELHALAKPTETLFVVDSMTGQDAVNSAKAFNASLPLTGIILTKMDGDTRGGAALSARFVTGKPIKFLTTGEKVQALEAFYPDRIASRIFGRGDIVSLVEEAERSFDRKEQEKLTKKLKKGKNFDLNDFLSQLKQMKKMGGIAGLLDKLPMLPAGAMGKVVDDKSLAKMEAMICSMTLKERRFPDNIRGSHKRRITAGSGTQIQELNHLLKRFTQMQKMMKNFGKAGSATKLLRSLQGKIPPLY